MLLMLLGKIISPSLWLSLYLCIGNAVRESRCSRKTLQQLLYYCNIWMKNTRESTECPNKVLEFWKKNSSNWKELECKHTFISRFFCRLFLVYFCPKLAGTPGIWWCTIMWLVDFFPGFFVTLFASFWLDCCSGRRKHSHLDANDSRWSYCLENFPTKILRDFP